MGFLSALVGDALLFAALVWLAGYGALGPALGLRLSIGRKLRLFAEVFAIVAALLYVFASVNRLAGWASAPPWPEYPRAHQLLALAAVLTVGFLYTRRRAQALDESRPAASSDDETPG